VCVCVCERERVCGCVYLSLCIYVYEFVDVCIYLCVSMCVGICCVCVSVYLSVTNLCKKASQKLHALSRVCNLMNTTQRKLIMNAFIKSQFGYCPLVWMFHSRKLNHRINRIHEKTLRIVYNDYVSNFLELLRKDNSFTTHERNIQTLGIELYKVINGQSPDIMLQVFQLKGSTRYPSESVFKTRNIRTTNYGTNTLSHLGPKIWSIIPQEIKKEKSLNSFTNKIRDWRPDKCPCNMCKEYIKGLGFI